MAWKDSDDTMRSDAFSALFWLFFAVYVAIESYRFGLGSWGTPGPGYFPFGAALCLGILSLSTFIKKPARASSEKAPVRSQKLRLQNVFLILLTMVAYILLLNKIGFFLCNFFFVVLFLRIASWRRWMTLFVIAFSVALGSHLLFNVLLNAQFPRGFILRFL